MTTLPDEPDERFVQCRPTVLGHQWVHFDPRVDEVDGNVTVVLPSRCSHCGTSREKRLSDTGGVVKKPRYKYPNGYRAKGRPPAAWRDQFVRHLVELPGGSS